MNRDILHQDPWNGILPSPHLSIMNAGFLALQQSACRVYKLVQPPCECGAALQHALVEEEDLDQDEELYCVCQQPDDGRLLVCCDNCQGWYHPECMGKIVEAHPKLVPFCLVSPFSQYLAKSLGTKGKNPNHLVFVFP